jgi:hypothetical protein
LQVRLGLAVQKDSCDDSDALSVLRQCAGARPQPIGLRRHADDFPVEAAKCLRGPRLSPTSSKGYLALASDRPARRTDSPVRFCSSVRISLHAKKQQLGMGIMRPNPAMVPMGSGK